MFKKSTDFNKQKKKAQENIMVESKKRKAQKKKKQKNKKKLLLKKNDSDEDYVYNDETHNESLQESIGNQDEYDKIVYHNLKLFQNNSNNWTNLVDVPQTSNDQKISEILQDDVKNEKKILDDVEKKVPKSPESPVLFEEKKDENENKVVELEKFRNNKNNWTNLVDVPQTSNDKKICEILEDEEKNVNPVEEKIGENGVIIYSEEDEDVNPVEEKIGENGVTIYSEEDEDVEEIKEKEIKEILKTDTKKNKTKIHIEPFPTKSKKVYLQRQKGKKFFLIFFFFFNFFFFKKKNSLII
jgi:hypothetical protein